MATMARAEVAPVRRETFWLPGAVLMAVVIAAGFSVHVALGRSSFSAPLYLHAHALLFFGWTALFVTQSALADTASMTTHRRLGWLSVAWIPAMVAMGIFTTLEMVRGGGVPFFFRPLYFLVMNPLSILTFAGLASAAIVLRHRTQWHRRLMFCSMAVLTGPAVGRLLPLPLLIPWAAWAVFAAVMLFPLAGVVRDLRRSGAVHPAWIWGIGTIVAAQILMDLLTESTLGLALYQLVTADAPGAAVAPPAYPPFPPG